MKKLKHLIVIVLFLGASPALFAQTSSEKLKSQQRSIQNKISNTKALIKATRSSKQLTMAEIWIIENQITYREELIANINHQMRKTTDQISHTMKEIEVHESNLKKLKADYTKMLRYAYKNRNTDYKLIYIFSSESVSQSYKRMKYLQEYASYRQKQANRIISEQGKLLNKISALESTKEQKLALAGEKDVERKNFLEDQTLQKQALGKLMSDEANLKNSLSQQQAKKKKLTSAIANAIAAEIAKLNKANAATTTSGFGQTPEIKLASKSFEANKGKLPWPVTKGDVTGKYGKHEHSVVKHTFVENNGIDISTMKGANVRAIFKGEVSSIMVISGAGKVVMVKHGSYRTVYSNLKEVFVKKGQKIDTKENIGQLLSEGSISEAHIEIWKINSDGSMSKQNPETWIYKK
jgi:septal ring factor EnvC (AmiA/AmiB activator)